MSQSFPPNTIEHKEFYIGVQTLILFCMRSQKTNQITFYQSLDWLLIVAMCYRTSYWLSYISNLFIKVVQKVGLVCFFWEFDKPTWDIRQPTNCLCVLNKANLQTDMICVWTCDENKYWKWIWNLEMYYWEIIIEESLICVDAIQLQKTWMYFFWCCFQFSLHRNIL